MAERNVKVRISAQLQGYIDGMQEAASKTRELGSETEKLTQQREAFEQIGRYATAGGLAIATGLGLATKAAIDWDSAWAGVTKTVDGSDAELAAVEAGLRGLTSVLPASHEEIAAVAEAAGQLGVETPNVVAFTRTMIDLGETTNLSADEAAKSLARFMTVMGTQKGEVDRIGSALVDLGNNYATTEAEIMAMAMRLSGAGAQIKLSEGQVLGLSTALSSVGIEAEAGGSAMSKVMIDIASSVDKGGDRVKMFAEVAGMSADDFSTKWKSAPGEALSAFVKGLANAEAQGKSTFGILEELGITEVRMRDALLRSASAADQFAGAMEQGNKAMEQNTALSAEAKKRYETTASQLAIMRNKVVDAAIGIGQQLLPALERGAEILGDFSDLVKDSGEVGQGAIVFIGGLASAALLSAGAFGLAVPKVAAYKAALATLGPVAQRTNAIMSTIGKGFGYLAAAYAIAEVGSALVDWSKRVSGAKREASELETSLRKTSDASRELDTAIKAGGPSFGEAYDTTIATDRLKQLNTVVGQMQASFESNSVGKFFTAISSLGMGGQLGTTKENIEALDQALSAMVASGDADRAAELYAEFAAKTAEAEWSAEKTAAALPGYAEATRQAGQEAKTGADNAKEAASGYMEQADAARAAKDELFKLLDALMEANGIGQSAEAANARYRQSLADVREYVEKARAGTEGYSRSLSRSTAAGSKNRDMFAKLAADSQASARATMEQETATLGADKAAANYASNLRKGRKALIDQITDLTGNREEARKLANQIYKIPTKRETKVLVDTATASKQVRAFIDEQSRMSFWVTGNVKWGNTAQNPSSAANHDAFGGTVGYATGGTIFGRNGFVHDGTVFGAGHSKSDSVNVFLSKGEEVIQEPYASRNRALLKAINRGEYVRQVQPAQQTVIVREIGDVYVQNPVTGEFLLSQMDDRARGVLKEEARVLSTASLNDRFGRR